MAFLFILKYFNAIIYMVIKLKRILIIEDDLALASELKCLLDNAGYLSYVVKDFKNVLNTINENDFDLILLDINIPYVNGELLLKEIRKTKDVPIIMVTSKNTEADEVLSISYGADDFITKPYNPTILLLRINNIFKRTSNLGSIINYKDLKVNVGKGIITKGKKEVILTKNEMIIFNYLLNNQNRIVSRDELMTDLWNNSEYVNDNALTVNISRLRAKLKNLGYENAIETRKKAGYILSWVF